MNTRPDREARAEQLFERALELPATERDDYLDAACEGEPDLRRELSALLPFAEDDPGFLTSPVPRPPALDAGATADAAPEKIGGYRIVRTLGYGGMAVVYEAIQAHPRRTVALKLLCPGPSTEGLARRFASEAELMGRLHHPGIAQIFEAGLEEFQSPEGAVYRLPFLAMEYVRGERLDRWATGEDHSLRDRLRLFAEVCDAVDYAHRQGVLHRDLKPANILVDEAGHPKVLDFGIARAVDSDGDAPTPLTATGQMVGTLAFMSPEQLDADRERIDARSDVYALGVILYQMLAGRPPYDIHQLGVAEAALLIEQTEAAPLGSVSRTLSGDLETIAAKAMAKGRERRYRSPAEIAADVRRYLAGQPIAARPASPWYRWRKFARRNRALVGGALATLLALVLGAAVAVYLALGQARSSAELAHIAYRSAIAAAIAALEDDDRPLAREALLAPAAPAAQEGLRGWEWRHLLSRAQPAALTVEARHGPGVFAPTLVVEDRRVLSLGNERGYRFDAATGELLDSWPLRRARMKHVAAPAVGVVHSPDGRYFALAAPAGEIRLHRAGEPACAVTRGSRIDFGPADSALAAITDESGTALGVWDLDACGERWRLALEPGDRRWLELSFGPGGAWLVGDVLRRDNRSELRIHDLEGRREFGRIRHRHGASAALAVSPDGATVVAGGFDGSLRFFDLASGRPTRRLGAHQGQVTRVGFDPSGRRLASAGADRLVRVWEVASGRKLAHHRAAGLVTALEFSRDGRRLVSASRGSRSPKPVGRAQDQILTILDLDLPPEPWVLGHDGSAVYALAWSPSGEVLAAGTSGGVIVLWDPRSYRKIARWWGHAGELHSLAWSGDGTRLVSTSGAETIAWDLAAGVDLAGLPIWASREPLRAPDRRGRRIVVGWDPVTRAASVWDLETGALTRTGTAAFVGTRGGWLSPDGRFVYGRLRDPFRVEILDLDRVAGDRGGVRTFPSPGLGTVFAFSNGAAGPVLFVGPLAGEESASADAGSTLGIWQASSGAYRGALSGPTRAALAVAFSPDDRRIATGGRDASVRLWDSSILEQVARLPGHTGFVRALAWSPDGTALASASDDGTVRLWDLLSTVEHLAIRERRRRHRTHAEILVASLLPAGTDYEAAIARLRADPSLDEGLRREVWWESLRQSVRAREAREAEAGALPVTGSEGGESRE